MGFGGWNPTPPEGELWGKEIKAKWWKRRLSVKLSVCRHGGELYAGKKLSERWILHSFKNISGLIN